MTEFSYTYRSARAAAWRNDGSPSVCSLTRRRSHQLVSYGRLCLQQSGSRRGQTPLSLCAHGHPLHLERAWFRPKSSAGGDQFPAAGKRCSYVVRRSPRLRLTGQLRLRNSNVSFISCASLLGRAGVLTRIVLVLRSSEVQEILDDITAYQEEIVCTSVKSARKLSDACKFSC